MRVGLDIVFFRLDEDFVAGFVSLLILGFGLGAGLPVLLMPGFDEGYRFTSEPMGGGGNNLF